MSKKIILAYSGGLDTTVIIPWLKDRIKGINTYLQRSLDNVSNYDIVK